MARFEDFPCCNHNSGDPCPDRDTSGRIIPRCSECNRRLPRHARSSICGTCQRRANRRFAVTGEMWPDDERDR